jgi:hypothetical protein
VCLHGECSAHNAAWHAGAYVAGFVFMFILYPNLTKYKKRRATTEPERLTSWHGACEGSCTFNNRNRTNTHTSARTPLSLWSLEFFLRWKTFFFLVCVEEKKVQKGKPSRALINQIEEKGRKRLCVCTHTHTQANRKFVVCVDSPGMSGGKSDEVRCHQHDNSRFSN